MGQAKLYNQKASGIEPIGALIDRYVYQATTVSAGDLVEYINGIAGQTSATNTPSVFNSANTFYISSTLIDTNKVIISYCDVGNSYYGTSIIASINGNTITYGSEYVFNSASTADISSTLVDTNKVIISYRDSGDYSAFAIIATISGTSITFGTGLAVGAGSSSYPSQYTQVVTLETNKVLMCWDRNRNSSSTTYGLKACVLTISGTTITNGTILNIEAYQHTYLSLCKLTTTTACLSYMDENNLKYGTQRVLTVSGTTVAAGSEYVFNSASTYYISATLIDTNKVIISYCDVGNSNYGTSIIASINGNTITYGSEYVFNSASTYYISSTLIDTNKVIISYRDYGNSSYGTSRIATVSGTTITFGSEYVFNSAITTDISSTLVDTNKVMISYRDGGNSYYGTACLVGVSNTTVSNTVVTTNYETQVRQTTTSQFDGVAKTSGTGGTSTAHGGQVSIYTLE